MGVFGFFLTVPTAMVLHGIAQAFSNGSRVWLYQRHIKWHVLIFYCVGALFVLVAFSIFQFVPDIGLVFILIGVFPFLALLLPDRVDLDMEKPGVSFSSGIVVTTAQMLAGASGPVLDFFYVQSAMSKEEILGTKAVTQTFGHIVKLIYYGSLITIAADTIPHWALPAVVSSAILGNYLGSLIVERITVNDFKRIGRYLVMVIGIVYLAKGIAELM